MFTLSNWTCVSSSLNQGQETITPFGGSPTVENAPNLFVYGSPNDTVATIEGSNYFLSQYASLSTPNGKEYDDAAKELSWFLRPGVLDKDYSK
jgi:hypothetical protein